MEFARILAFLALLLPVPGLARAQDGGEVTSSPANTRSSEDDIRVIGDRKGEAKAVRDLTTAVTKRGPSDKPLPRFYQPFCPIVLGIQADYAGVLVERIRQNAREADATVAKGKCQPNALLIFTKDARATLGMLHKDYPWFFHDLSGSQVRRLAESGDQVFAWQASEVRGADGKAMRIVEVEIGSPPVRTELTINNQWQTGRLNQPIRMDVNGAIVLIDNRYLPGKTLTQLADYATMRLLATTNDVSPEEMASVSTILSLFTAPADAPPGLTAFDTGYLRARYALRPNANALAIKDATAKAYTQETGK